MLIIIIIIIFFFGRRSAEAVTPIRHNYNTAPMLIPIFSNNLIPQEN